MYYIAELIGVFLVAYGIWFASKGVQRSLGLEKDWWRPLRGRKRYPYPVAGVLLGVCFIVLGLRFALNRIWIHVQVLSYVGAALFVLVLVIGIAQPRFLHPRWYRHLQGQLGNEGMLRLKKAAFQMEDEEWIEVSSTEAEFDQWVKRVMSGRTPGQAPGQVRRPGRGYQRSKDRKSQK